MKDDPSPEPPTQRPEAVAEGDVLVVVVVVVVVVLVVVVELDPRLAAFTFPLMPPEPAILFK